MLLTGANRQVSVARLKAQDIREAALGWPRHITPARLVLGNAEPEEGKHGLIEARTCLSPDGVTPIFKVARVELPRI
jgi:hypothetical protein